MYSQITLATGGQYRSLPVSDAGSITGLIETLTTSNNRYILKIEDVFATTGTTGGSASFQVPVDSRMTKVTFSASGGNVDMEIRTPNGNRLDLGLPSVNSQVLRDGEFVVITDPVVGVYRVILRGTGSFSLDCTGSDPLSFSAFDVVETCGRDGHRGYCPISSPPAFDHDVGVVATIDGGFKTAVFELRNLAGKKILDIPMEAGSGEFGEPPINAFFGQFRYPEGSFYVYVSGQDPGDTRYQRVLATVITPVASGTNNTGLEDEFAYVNGTVPDTSSSSSTTMWPTSSTMTTRTRTSTPGVAPPGVAPSVPSSSSTPSEPTVSPSIDPSIDPSVTPTAPTLPPPPSSSPTSTRIRTPGVAIGVAPVSPSSTTSEEAVPTP